MSIRIYIISLILFCTTGVLAQTEPAMLLPDSLAEQQQVDTLPPVPKVDYKVSEDSLDAEVNYTAEDSMRLDNKAQEVHLYGDAVVKYLNLSLKADYIVFNVDSNIATAVGRPDSAGVIRGNPVFTEGDQSFEARKMRYNFRTQKGIIYDVITTEGDLFIHGRKTKYVGGVQTDTIQREDHVYQQGALITTCNAPEPHFGIRSRRIKTIPEKLAVIGPSNVEIHGVPTPLWLPFGFFPITSGKSSGLIFPNDYEYSESWGFGLREVGWYFPISDYIDAKVLGDIYFNGSWGLQVQSNYVKRYKYRGNMNLGFSSRKNEVAGSINPSVTKSFSIRISHNQDAKAHPYRKLGGSINIQSNDYRSLNRNDANSVLTNTYRSNFSWSRTFPGKPYSLSVSFNHSQNTRSREVTIDAPNVDFRLNRIYPFKRKQGTGKEKFYEKLGFQYSGNTRTKFTATDSTIFSQETWENALFGVQHRANADLSFSVFNYIHVTPSVDYEQIWFFKTLRQEFSFDPETAIEMDTITGPDGSTIIVPDTVSFGEVTEEIVSGFKPYSHYSTGVSLNTQLFATLQMKKGFLRGLRHVLKPSFSFSYEPKNSHRYEDSVRTDIRSDELLPYSIFGQGGLYSARIVRGERAAIGYSFNNIFEAKIFSKKDSTEKKIKLFDNIVVSGNYNFVPDTLNFSQINIRGTTRLFQKATTLSFSAVYDPYDFNPKTRRRIKDYYYDTKGKLLRFDNLSVRLSTRLTIKRLRDIFRGKDENEDQSGRSHQPGSGSRGGTQRAEVDKFFDLMNDFSIDHNLGLMRIGQPGPDTTITTTHTVNMRGTMRLTPKWTITVGNIGYDFRNDRLTYPDIGFIRDLHCWDLRFSWQPQRGTYTLHLGVKPGSLDFIKIPHNRNLPDSFGGF